ncbi:MAG: NlpC/P60 family protein [Chlorobium sp.]|nr:MAG: NlpC/P60 family protein [Chlorobium sp.]
MPFKKAMLLCTVVGTMFGMSSCQSFRTGSGDNFASKYSLKKRKTHISCTVERGGPAVIKPLPLKVSAQAFDRLLPSVDELLGTSYRIGGSTPDGFDCSGFVLYLYKQQFRMILPRTTGELALLGIVVPEHNLKPGDLVFFSIDGNNIDHVGIVIDHNHFAHAANSGVRVDTLLHPYYRARYAFGERIITTE